MHDFLQAETCFFFQRLTTTVNAAEDCSATNKLQCAVATFER